MDSTKPAFRGNGQASGVLRRGFLRSSTCTIVLALSLITVSLKAGADTNDPANVPVLLRQCHSALLVLEEGGAGVSETETVEAGVCIGFITGVGGHMQRLCGFANLASLPLEHRLLYQGMAAGTSTYSRHAAIRTFVEYARKHPEKWNQGSIAVIDYALKEAAPCQLEDRR